MAAAAGAAAPFLGLSMPALIGAIVVVVIVIAGAALLLSHGPSKSATTTVSSTGSGGSTSVTGTSGYGTSASNATCGPGNYCMSASEAAALIGPGGKWTAVYGNQNSYLAAAFGAAAAHSNSTAFYNNVTGVYIAAYNITGIKNNLFNGSVMLEYVFQSPHAQWIYRNMVNDSSGSFNATNVTVDGLTYSYIGVSIQGYNSTWTNETVFYGYKNNEAGFILDFGTKMDQSKLASTVAGDFP